MLVHKKYNVGIYIRLSREDEDKTKLESESITNQRNFIINYIKKSNDNFTIYDEYIDDGISGTTFERPGFNRMIEDIENGKINCVISKDYSRLGRDYIKSGEYLERYFPEHNIRYIAILDNIDTISEGVGNDIAPYRAILNDQYAKDISRKVRSSMYTKKCNGNFLGWKAVYGYKKDKNDNNKLVIDDEAAKIVKRIFNLSYEGKSCKQIADILSNENIPIPSVYANLNRGRKSTSYGLWCSRTIDEMLTNQTYIGNLTQGRRKKVNYKIKKEVRVPKDEWIVVNNTHEPIIDKELFDKVQLLREKNKNKQNKSHNYLLKGFLFCKECGHAISICKRTDRIAYTGCSHYQRYSKFKLCTPHSMNYQKLEQEILKEVEELCKKYVNIKRLEEILKKSSKVINKKNKLIGDIKSSTLERERLLNLKKKIYFDKINDVISVSEYKDYSNFVAEEIIKHEKKLLEYKKQLEKMDNLDDIQNDYKKVIKEYLCMKRPSRYLLANIIDKIIIDKNKNVSINLRIKHPEISYNSGFFND